MQDESTPAQPVSVDALERQSERVVLMILTEDPGLWHLDEIKRQVFEQHEVFVEDAVNRLATHGLVHRIDDFAFASRAALRAQNYTP